MSARSVQRILHYVVHRRCGSVAVAYQFAFQRKYQGSSYHAGQAGRRRQLFLACPFCRPCSPLFLLDRYHRLLSAASRSPAIPRASVVLHRAATQRAISREQCECGLVAAAAATALLHCLYSRRWDYQQVNWIHRSTRSSYHTYVRSPKPRARPCSTTGGAIDSPAFACCARAGNRSIAA